MATQELRDYFTGSTLDDVLRGAVTRILAYGTQIVPSKGPARELFGVFFELTNPRARLSRTESRGKLFSALGELCWYLAGSNSGDFIGYYLSVYEKFARNGIVPDGYGPRLFNWEGVDQISEVTRRLRRRPVTRKAVVQLFCHTDLHMEHGEAPCTCTLQFVVRDGRLNMLTSMRSSDVHWGLPHDVFALTMLQEIIARDLGVSLGTYKHVVGSLHLYDEKEPIARRFLNEGWQSTTSAMPPMPAGDPWPGVTQLLEAESVLRLGGEAADGLSVNGMDPYWADLVRLLKAFRYRSKTKDEDNARALISEMKCDVYRPYLLGKP
ncbi:thymidylate synthase [Planctomycetota bacterium]